MPGVRIQQLRCTPVQRIETGVVQFCDDWPGIFLRGDEALALAEDLRMSRNLNDDGMSHRRVVDRIIDLLRSCEVDVKAA